MCVQDNTPVVLADTLDLSPYCSLPDSMRSQKAMYRLVAVSKHSGTMNGGHYTAQCRSAVDGRWYEYSDTMVWEDMGPRGLSSAPYVLLYRLQEQGLCEPLAG